MEAVLAATGAASPAKSISSIEVVEMVFEGRRSGSSLAGAWMGEPLGEISLDAEDSRAGVEELSSLCTVDLTEGVSSRFISVGDASWEAAGEWKESPLVSSSEESSTSTVFSVDVFSVTLTLRAGFSVRPRSMSLRLESTSFSGAGEGRGAGSAAMVFLPLCR